MVKDIWRMESKGSTCAKVIHSRIFNIALLCLFVLCAGIYNYGLRRSFWPDYEYCDLVYYRFLDELHGHNVSLARVYYTAAYIPYRLFGCSLKAVRVCAVTIYQLIIFFSSIAVIYSFKKKCFEWYKLGIFAFIAVILHPGSSPFCGQYHTLFHQYPYDVHAPSAIFATLSIMLLCVYQGITERKYKYVLKVIILAVIVVGYKLGDFLYILDFVGPLICIGLIYLWKEKRKAFFALIYGVIAAVALLHVISFVVPSLEPLFVHTSITYGTWTNGSTVYGNNGFANLSNIWNYVSTTTIELLALFNIDISEKSMLSISTLLAGIRLILVIFLFVCSFRTIIDAIRKEKDYKSLDFVNIVLALGILFNFFLVMFSSYGSGTNCIRYMTLILFYGAIFLARQSENIIAKLYGDVDLKSKLYFFLLFSFAIVANMATFWKEDEYVADYEPAIKSVSSFIAENHLGNGIGGQGYSSILTIIGEGDYAVVAGKVTDEGLDFYIRSYNQVPATFNYIVDWPNGYASFDAETIYRCLGEPDAVYEMNGFVIYYYPEGFGT